MQELQNNRMMMKMKFNLLISLIKVFVWMMKLFQGFHYQISKMILGKTARYVKEEVWEWPPAEEALEAAGLWPIQEYLLRRHPTIEY